MKGERSLREAAAASKLLTSPSNNDGDNDNLNRRYPATRDTTRDEGGGGVVDVEDVEDEDEVDLSWATVFKRTFEGYIRNERPNMYGEWLRW